MTKNVTSISDYIDWLLGTNAKVLDDAGLNLRDYHAVASFAFGLFEEFGLEFVPALGSEQAKQEAGDVLAYTVLLLFSLGLSSEQIKAFVEETEGDYNNFPNLYEIASELKRVFRGDDDIRVNVFTDECDKALSFCLSMTGLTIQELVDINYTKLFNRFKNTSTFNGRGDR